MTRRKIRDGIDRTRQILPRAARNTLPQRSRQHAPLATNILENNIFFSRIQMASGLQRNNGMHAGGSVPNAASLIPRPLPGRRSPRPNIRPRPPRVPRSPSLLDIGTEPPPPPRDHASPRADDVRDAKRPDGPAATTSPRVQRRRQTRPRPKLHRTPAKAPPAAPAKDQTGASTTSEEDADAETSKVDEKTGSGCTTTAATTHDTAMPKQRRPRRPRMTLPSGGDTGRRLP